MQDRNYQFTPKVGNVENQGMTGGVEHFGRASESSAADVTQADLGPAHLSPESITLLDQALNIASLSPSDLQYADQDALHLAFHRLNGSVDLPAKKSVLKEIVQLVNAGV